MKHLLYTILTILGFIALASLLAPLTGCASSGSVHNLAKQNRQDIMYERQDREVADNRLDRAINRRHTEVLNLAHELKQLRETMAHICANQPEACEEPKELENWK